MEFVYAQLELRNSYTYILLQINNDISQNTLYNKTTADSSFEREFIFIFLFLYLNRLDLSWCSGNLKNVLLIGLNVSLTCMKKGYLKQNIDC